MKIAYFTFEPWEKEYVERSSILPEGSEIVFFEHILSAEKLPDDRTFDVLALRADSNVDEAVVNAFLNVKLIAARSTGFDHIDLDACATRGIVVVNVPAYGAETVAEYAFALLLALSRRIHDAVNRVRETGKFYPEGLRGFDLNGKTLGVVGTGKIGKNVIQIAKGFDMNVIAYDPYPDPAYAEKMQYPYKSLDEVLAESDIVTLHVPYMESTHHLLNKASFAMMKHGAILVNDSRGAVVETEALVEALQSGQLGGAALDVLEEESIMKDEVGYIERAEADPKKMRTVLANHALIDMQNVIVTPHNAFNTIEALKRMVDTTLENIAAFAAGKSENVVKLET